MDAGTATFPFTGTGRQISNSFHFQISGNDFFYSIGTTEGPLIVTNCESFRHPCSFLQSYTAGVLPPSDQFGMTAILDGVETHITTGELTFLGTVSPPAAPGPFTAVIPVSFAADILGRGPVSQDFAVLFEVLLGGVGTAELSGIVFESGDAVVNQARYTFSGIATAEQAAAPIPEPASLLLSAGGAALLALAYRRRRRARP